MGEDEAKRIQRNGEEIDAYETCLERLHSLWFENGPGQFSDLLNNCLDDVEALAMTTQVFDVKVRLLAVLQLMLGKINDQDGHRAAARLMATMRAMPDLKWVYCRRMAGAE